ncbi:MAG: moeB [Rickettsiales bacterium]|jgi:adenylyltransferase/sulfurtransferase|nr:moeB [Rickettsiales bacterium]
MFLTERETERYSRQICLESIGMKGQMRLKAVKVLVIGAGGLGSPLLYYLAAAGIGTLGVIDNDHLERSNLQRQILHDEAHIDQPKVVSAKNRLLAFNPDIILHTYEHRLDEANAADLFRQYDLIADGSDNSTTRYLVNDACVALKKPLVSGAARGFQGQVCVFKPGTSGSPCYRCLYPDVPENIEDGCSRGGIIGSVAGIIGSFMATEIIKEILHEGESLCGSMLIYEGLKGSFRKVTLAPDPHCPTCSKN